jgi:predicted DNA-binding transcriptional regulator AlpA
MSYAQVMAEDDEELMTEEDVAAMLLISHSSMKRLRASGNGPRYIRISPRVVRYKRRDVLDWIRQGGTEEP